MRRVLGSFWVFAVALAVVAGVVLALTPSAPSAAQRIAHLESLVRCPACEDLSVAQSNAPSSVAVRDEIARRVHEGWSDTRVLTALEDQYGPAVLLSPDAGALGDLLWIAPLALAGVFLYALVRLDLRRRR